VSTWQGFSRQLPFTAQSSDAPELHGTQAVENTPAASR
jgi:hypothetical protein